MIAVYATTTGYGLVYIVNMMKGTYCKILSTISGMNTGIQDAHNIAWKLALVCKGIAPASCLSTYEVERSQVLLF